MPESERVSSIHAAAYLPGCITISVWILWNFCLCRGRRGAFSRSFFVGLIRDSLSKPWKHPQTSLPVFSSLMHFQSSSRSEAWEQEKAVLSHCAHTGFYKMYPCSGIKGKDLWNELALAITREFQYIYIIKNLHYQLFIHHSSIYKLYTCNISIWDTSSRYKLILVISAYEKSNKTVQLILYNSTCCFISFHWSS